MTASFVNSKIRTVSLLIFCSLLLLQFNNCSPINSQQVDAINQSSLAGSSADVPVNPANPYVLQCVLTSNGTKIASVLTKSLRPASKTSVNGKITSLDWNQDVDLIVSLDNQCVFDSEFSDPIIAYLDRTQINLKLPKTVYVIKKEGVTNLNLFIKDALASECLISADKNFELKVSGVDTFYINQSHLGSSASNPVAIDATTTTLDNILNYVSSAPASQRKVKVAVIDTGVDYNNPDLRNVMTKNGVAFNGVNSTGTSTDLNDSGFHGTHVAGLIAAQYNNDIGVTGVYGSNVELINYRASNDGNGLTISALVNALTDARTVQNADIINMSLGATDDYEMLRNAINDTLDANITIVAAAGNDGYQLIPGVTPAQTTYPAMYSNDPRIRANGLITVGSVDLKSRTRSLFSNYSATYVDVLAPGSNGDILTTTTNNREGIFSTIPSNYNITTGQTTGPGYGSILNIAGAPRPVPIHGTSMAAPIVTGALAAVISMAKSKGRPLTNVQLKQWLRNGGSPRSTAFENFSYQGNYLNLTSLYNYVRSQIDTVTPPPPPSVAPTITVQPVNRKAVLDERVELSVTATSTGTLTYQWYKNNAVITGATNRILVFNRVGEADGAVYRVRVSAGGQNVTSQDAELKVAMKYCN